MPATVCPLAIDSNVDCWRKSGAMWKRHRTRHYPIPDTDPEGSQSFPREGLRVAEGGRVCASMEGVEERFQPGGGVHLVVRRLQAVGAFTRIALVPDQPDPDQAERVGAADVLG